MVTVLKFLLSQLLDLLTPDIIVKVIDQFLDSIENAVKTSDNQIDDAIVLPLIATIRAALKIK